MTEHTAQHTPGPWKADIRTGCSAIYPSNEDHNCLCGSNKWAVMYQDGRGEDSAPGGYPLLTEEQKANARLIAESPAMYDYILIQARRGDMQAQDIINQIERPN